MQPVQVKQHVDSTTDHVQFVPVSIAVSAGRNAT